MRDLSPHIAGWLSLVGSLHGDARVTSADGVTWSVTDIPWPMFNAGVAAATADPDTVDAALAELDAKGLPWFWFVLPRTPPYVLARIGASGATPFDERAPWMEIPRAELPAPGPASGVTVAEALEDGAVRAWAQTLQDSHGFPDAGRDSWIDAALRRDAAAPQFRLWTVLDHGGPAAITLGFVAAGIVGQFGVGVLPGRRGTGLGRLVTLIPPAALDAPVAGHWATPDGERMYAKLGMRANGWVTRYLGGTAAIPTGAAGGHARS